MLPVFFCSLHNFKQRQWKRPHRRSLTTMWPLNWNFQWTFLLSVFSCPAFYFLLRGHQFLVSPHSTFYCAVIFVFHHILHSTVWLPWLELHILLSNVCPSTVGSTFCILKCVPVDSDSHSSFYCALPEWKSYNYEILIDIFRPSSTSHHLYRIYSSKIDISYEFDILV